MSTVRGTDLTDDTIRAYARTWLRPVGEVRANKALDLRFVAPLVDADEYRRLADPAESRESEGR